MSAGILSANVTVCDTGINHSHSNNTEHGEKDWDSGVGGRLEGGEGVELDGCGAGHVPDSYKVKVMCERLQHKISRTKQLIQREQAANERNVGEYLAQCPSEPLSSSVGGPSSKAKAEFERKNQKSVHSIARLQRKLEDYQRRLNELATTGSYSGSASYLGGHSHRPAKTILKDVGHGIKELFIKDGLRSRESSPCDYSRCYGDNKNLRDVSHNHKKAASLDNMFSATITAPVNGLEDRYTNSREHNTGSRELSDEDASHSSALSDSMSGDNVVSPVVYSSRRAATSSVDQADKTRFQDEMVTLLAELKENQDIQRRLQDTFNNLKIQFDEESECFRQTLDEERERCERLEEQLNDISELHQHEINNIKQELSSMQEKMEYQLDERTRDMQELLESCQTKISKIEMQQHHQQQLISMEDLENSNFRVLIAKLINVVLAVLSVVLLLVSTTASVVGPLLTNRFRIVTTVCFIACLIAAWDNWPVIYDTADKLIVERFKNLWIVKSHTVTV